MSSLISLFKQKGLLYILSKKPFFLSLSSSLDCYNPNICLMGFYFNKWFKPNVDDNSTASPSEHTRHPCQTGPRWPPERYLNPPRTSQASSCASSFRKSTFSDQNVGPILGKPYVDINTIYDVDRELGRGQFGITYLCTEKTTGLKYACKSISKTKLVNENSVEDVRREIQILEHLRGQPNIVEFKGAYEDRQNLHLVLQLCSGGELFDRIIGKGIYSEREAAVIMRQIVNVVHACHSMGVMHRDLKPENFLFVDKADDSPLKATDFGLSVFVQQGLVYRDLVGSAYYIAPEVLNRNYGKEVDVWSAGVILYILLSGTPPFWAENEEGIFEEILKGQLDLESPPWPNISCSAKDIIRKMLARNPKERITAAQALEHPWLKVEREAKGRQCNFKILLSQRRPCFKTTL